MKCGSCGQEVVYAGPQRPHFSTAIAVQDEAEPFRFHRCEGGTIVFKQWMYVVPMYDGQLIMAMQISFN